MGKGFNIRFLVGSTLIAVMLASVFVSIADAGRARNTVTGAAIGAGVGAVVDGGRGARRGAAVGAVIGAVR